MTKIKFKESFSKNPEQFSKSGTSIFSKEPEIHLFFKFPEKMLKKKSKN
jgi:hypothetical protein